MRQAMRRKARRKDAARTLAKVARIWCVRLTPARRQRMVVDVLERVEGPWELTARDAQFFRRHWLLVARRCAVRIQAFWKRRATTRWLHRLRARFDLLRSLWRRRLQRRRAVKESEAVVHLQRMWRGCRARWTLLSHRAKALPVHRGPRTSLETLRGAAVRIQAFLRLSLVRAVDRRFRSALVYPSMAEVEARIKNRKLAKQYRQLAAEA